MAAGDFLILRNSADGAILPNAGGVLDALWDTSEYVEGNAATYSAGTFTFTNTAPYLVMYSERFDTTNTTNNERVEGQGRIRLNGVDLVQGAGEGYIRKASGDQEMIINGIAIINATAGDTMTTRFYRGDNSVAGTVFRVPNFGGVQILELSAADDFAEYTTTANQTLSNAESNVTSWSTTTEESGFSRSGDTVTLSSAGRYFMCFSGPTSQTGSSRIGATVFAENGTTEITGVRGYSHQRGADGNQNGALGFAGIIDVAANDTITLRGDADSGSMTLDSGSKWQFWRLPASNETAIVEATTGNMNTNADFEWDTLAHIDAGFTHTAGTTNIDVNQGCHALAFWNQGKKVIDSAQRASPVGRISINDEIVNYAASSSYHRNSGGIGAFMAHGAGALLHTIPPNSSIKLYNTELAVQGNLDVESGHLSVLKLEGLYKNYSYTFPVTVTSVDSDNAVDNVQAGVAIAGIEFGATQGSGVVEIVSGSDYASSTKVAQVVNSWTDTLINVDIDAGVLADGSNYLFVTNDQGGRGSILINAGLPSYSSIIASQLPDHWWKFDNDSFADSGYWSQNNPITVDVDNASAFITTPISEATTHSWQALNSKRSPNNSDKMNQITTQDRLMGGWIRCEEVYTGLTCIYEEGGGVNNICFLIGMGNILIASYADTGDDNAQAFSDFALEPLRPYHIMFRFSHTDTVKEFRMYIDGVLQQVTTGNPLTSGNLDGHSGDITFGGPGGSLEVGGTDVTFSRATDMLFSNWVTWSESKPDADILELFQRGARPTVTINSDTQANMQAALDAIANTVRPNAPLAIRVQSPLGGGDLSLDADNIVFNDSISIQVEWRGAGTLNWKNLNGSNLVADKVYLTQGGTINVINPATLTLNGIQNPSEVRVYEAGTENEIAGQESVTSGTFSTSVETSSVDIRILSLGYQNLKLEGVDTTTDTALPIQQLIDRQYAND